MGPSRSDRAACARALAATEMTELADRPIGRLSGGQLQRAWIAKIMAQDAPRIFLDIAHAFEVPEPVRRLRREEGRSVVLVLHDLNMAMRYADRVVLFEKGRVVAAGATGLVLTERRVSEVFGIRCRIVDLDGDGGAALILLPSHEPDQAVAD